MYASITAIILLGISLAWTALNKSGVPASDWYISMIFIGFAYLAFWVKPRRLLSPPLPRPVSWTIRGLLAYAIFQVIPMPLGLLQFLSPVRAELTHATAAVTGPIAFAPLSLDPAADVLWILTLGGCAAAFFLVRDATFRLQNRFFIALLPPILVATFEAVLGILQVAGGAEQAIGSYNSRDHYCCILELTLPVTISLGMFYFRRRFSDTSIWPILKAMLCWMSSLLITLGIFFSLSRAGWVDSLLSLLMLVILLLFPHLPSTGWRLGILAALLISVVALFLLVTPEAMLTRLVGTLSPDSEGRIYIWRELMPLTREFRWFGTGLMGFSTAFLKYQAIINSKTILFAHNDFLQYLIELGLVGFVPLIYSVASLIWPMGRASWPKRHRESGSSRSEMRVLMVGCMASIFALFLHSLVDFNLYVPANTYTFAWILGFASALAVVMNAKSNTSTTVLGSDLGVLDQE